MHSFLSEQQLADVAGMDQHVAGARDALDNLIGWVSGRVDWDDTRLSVEMTQALLNQPAWGRAELATVLGAALSRLRGKP